MSKSDNHTALAAASQVLHPPSNGLQNLPPTHLNPVHLPPTHLNPVPLPHHRQCGDTRPAKAHTLGPDSSYKLPVHAWSSWPKQITGDDSINPPISSLSHSKSPRGQSLISHSALSTDAASAGDALPAVLPASNGAGSTIPGCCWLCWGRLAAATTLLEGAAAATGTAAARPSPWERWSWCVWAASCGCWIDVGGLPFRSW